MFQSKQIEFRTAVAVGEASSEQLCAVWIGGKVAEALGLEGDVLDDICSAILFSSIEAQQLGLSPDVVQAISQRGAHWDGSGEPQGLSGENILIGARIAALANVAAAAFTQSGAKGAFAAVMQQASMTLDPHLADIFLRLAGSALFWAILEKQDLASHLFDAEGV
jgi:HD domain